MTFQENEKVIRWRLHLASPPEKVYDMLATDEGRARFWAESAVGCDGFVDFVFINGFRWRARIVECEPPRRFAVEYIGGSLATFELAGNGSSGTDLTLTDERVPAADRVEVIAGWVSVLMALKAAVDFGVDLRNHDPLRSWAQGYVEN